MPYVERNEAGEITGISRRPQPGRAEEKLTDDHAEILAFRGGLAAPAQGNAPGAPSDLEVRLALLEDAAGGAPDKAAIAAKRAAMVAARQ
jgi:hypothetical protein